MPQFTEDDVVHYFAGVLTESEDRQMEEAARTNQQLAAWMEELSNARQEFYDELVEVGLIASPRLATEGRRGNSFSRTTALAAQTGVRRIPPPFVVVSGDRIENGKYQFRQESKNVPYGIVHCQFKDAQTGRILAQKTVVMGDEESIEGVQTRSGQVSLTGFSLDAETISPYELPATLEHISQFSEADLLQQLECFVKAGRHQDTQRVQAVLKLIRETRNPS